MFKKILNWFSGTVHDIKKGDAEFIDIKFYLRHKGAIVLLFLFSCSYISVKFAHLLQKEEIITLKQQLRSARTECVRASSEFKTQVRESRMKMLADSMNLRLTVPEQPAYTLIREK